MAQRQGATGSTTFRARYRRAAVLACLSFLLLAAIAPQADAAGLDAGSECHANGSCLSRACAPHPDGRHYCRAAGMDCAAPESDGLLSGYTDTVDGRTWMCRKGGNWRSSPKRANGARCGDDSQCASGRCQSNPDGYRYCLAQALDCSDSRMNGVAAGYSMQIRDKSWTCSASDGWGPARFSDFSDGVGIDRECRAGQCKADDERCRAQNDSRLRYCLELKEIEIELGKPVSLAITEGRDAAVRAGVRTIPKHIKAELQEFFPPYILNKVRYRVGMPGNSEILRFAFEWLRTSAFVMDYVIVFRNTDDATSNMRLWAHELEHVIQYEILGIDRFAQRWIQAAKRGAYDEDRTTIEGAATARAVYVCSHIDC